LDVTAWRGGDFTSSTFLKLNEHVGMHIPCIKMISADICSISIEDDRPDDDDNDAMVYGHG